jgi:diacylglycerol kinase family enzyme
VNVVTSEQELVAAVRQLPIEPNLEVGILGGDGTHMRVMTALHAVRGRERLPVLVSLPFGTVNTTNRRWYGKGRPLEALSYWLNREPLILRRQRSLSVELDGGEFIACTVGTGLVAQFFEAYERAGGGPAAAARIAIQSFFGSFISNAFSRTIMRPTECRITVDGKLIEPEHFSLVVCSVFKDVGLGIKVTYRAGNSADRIALVTSSLPASKLGPQFWRVLSGRALRDPQGVDSLVHEWSISFRDCGPLIIDGDRFDIQNARIRPGPIWSVLCPT